MAQLSLLHAQLTEALTSGDLLLRQVAVQARTGLRQLSLLGSLLAHGLADVGQLASGRLAKLCTLGGELAELLTALQAKLCLLHRGLSGLLAKSALRLSLLAVELTDPRHELRLLHRLLLLGLLQLSQLHGRLSIEPGLLKALLCGLKTELPLLACQLACQTGLLSLELCGLLPEACLLCGSPDCALTSLLHHPSGLLAKTGLLGRRGRLKLCGLRQLLRSVLAKTGLLCGDVGLQACLCAQCLCTLLLQCCLLCGSGGLCRASLTQHACCLLAKTGLLCGDTGLLSTKLANALCSGSLALLLLLERGHGLRLRLAIALRQKVGNRAGALIHQVAFHLGTLHAFALTTEGTSTDRLCGQALLRNRPLAIDLLHGLVDDLLLVRVHEPLGRGRIVSLRGTAKLADALLNCLLGCAKTGLLRGLRGLLGSSKLSTDTALETGLLCSLHSSLRGLHASLLSLCEAGLGGGHPGLVSGSQGRRDALCEAGLLRRLLRLLCSTKQGFNALAKARLLRRLLRHVHGPLALGHRGTEPRLRSRLCRLLRGLRSGQSCTTKASNGAGEVRRTGGPCQSASSAKVGPLLCEPRLASSASGHLSGCVCLAEAAKSSLLRDSEIRNCARGHASSLAKQGLRARKVRAHAHRGHALGFGQAREPLSDSRRRRPHVGLAGHRGHVLGRGQRAKARVDVLEGVAEAARGVGSNGTRPSRTQVTQPLLNRLDASANVGGRATSLLHCELRISELLAGVCAAQDVGSLAGGGVRATQGLVGRSHVGRERAYALLLGGLDGRELGRGEARDLIAGELLRQRGAVYVERKVLRFL